MRVRVATTVDVDLLLDWMEDFNRLEGIAFARDRMAAALAPLVAAEAEGPAPGRALVAEHEGAAVGYAVVTWGYDLEFAGRDAWLTELYLVPGARGRGLGRVLVDDIVAFARSRDVHALHLAVRPDNVIALALYRDAGFAPWTRLAFTKLL
jgi:ribosomal protein S18 acetylase RimI-like enzyme